MQEIENNWVALTCRRVHEQRYKEERDALSADWIEFCRVRNFLPAILPNCSDIAIKILNTVRPRLIIITGGNDVVQTNFGDFSEQRNETEKQILNWALEERIPILGVCRGMHVINDYFGGNVQAFGISEEIHKSTTHMLQVFGDFKEKLGFEEIRTNSFHRQGIRMEDLASGLEAVALCKQDKTVEALMNKKAKFIGIGWHPERLNTSHSLDNLIIDYLLKN